jgi:hypothetical protein
MSCPAIGSLDYAGMLRSYFRGSLSNKASSSNSVMSNSCAHRVMKSYRENESLLMGRSKVALHSRRTSRPFADLANAASTRRRGPLIGALNGFRKLMGLPGGRTGKLRGDGLSIRLTAPTRGALFPLHFRFGLCRDSRGLLAGWEERLCR